MNEQQLLRYSRHILLDEIDLDGQDKLNKATVLVIGCGGLGNACIPLLATSGIGHLILCDNDKVELSNLPRQSAFCERDIGQFKAHALQQYIQNRNPEVKTTILTERAGANLLADYVPKCDVIVDCSDNAATRYLLNQTALHYKKPLISASVIQFSGQLMVFDLRNAHSPCYACMFPQEALDVSSCLQNGVFAPLVHIIGAAQAAEVLKLIMHLGAPSTGKVTQFEGLDFTTFSFQLDKNNHCPACSTTKL